MYPPKNHPTLQRLLHNMATGRYVEAIEAREVWLAEGTPGLEDCSTMPKAVSYDTLLEMYSCMSIDHDRLLSAARESASLIKDLQEKVEDLEYECEHLERRLTAAEDEAAAALADAELANEKYADCMDRCECQ